MFKKKISVLLFSMILIISGLLSGCSFASSDADTASVYVAVLIGSHENAPKANLGLAEDAIYNACLSYGSVCLICVDGDPYTVEVEIDEQASGLSKSKLQAIALEQTQQILAAAEEMLAQTEEVDYLKAVQLAARYFDSIEDVNAERILISLDSALSTTGVISFTEIALSALDNEDIVSQLEALGEIPDLTDVTAYLYTIGDVAGDQAELTAADKTALSELWETVFRTAGADVFIQSDLPLSTEYEEELPFVSAVPVSKSAVDITSAEETASALEAEQIINFDETSIQFQAGSAELLDEEAAAEALSYITEYLIENPDEQILIAGTTAGWGSESDSLTLSKERVETIKNLLTESGIAENRITTLGLGYTSSFYIADKAEDGSLDEDIAPLNRTVKIMLLSSAVAQELLAE